MAWRCVKCGYKRSDRPDSCPKCGLVQAGEGTHEKYQILEEYCHRLSLIMRNQGIEHYFVDACAGSGYVQHHLKRELIAGSPIIMAETRNWVESKIRNKTLQPHARCVCIEADEKTFNLLMSWMKSYGEFVELKLGDCNVVLEEVLNGFDSKQRKPFAFIYIDPFGLGDPVIRRSTVERVLARPYTEVFIHFSCWGIERPAGYLKHLDSSNENLREKATSMIETLDTFLGGPQWREIWLKYSDPSERREKLLEFYTSGLRQYYEYIERIEIPVGSRNPSYCLIFTTRNPTGKKIMKYIMDTRRRKGAEPLERFMPKNLNFLS